LEQELEGDPELNLTVEMPRTHTRHNLKGNLLKSTYYSLPADGILKPCIKYFQMGLKAHLLDELPQD
jgi:hypothetical protein